MSFYGSVYYQLIDTFYKIIVKNSGDKTTAAAPSNLINPSGTASANIIDSQAQGRKGILQFDSGNKWIQFTQDTSVGADVAGYKVWHAVPNSADGTVKGFQSVGATKPSGKTATELKEHDYFYGSTLNYDKAGHVTGVTETLYRLPQTTVTDDITDLKADMGYGGEVSGHGPTKTVVKIEEQSNSNKSRLDTLDDYIADDWTNIANDWSSFKPSVQNVIGDMDNLYTDLPSSLGTIYKTHYNSSSSPFKNLVSIIGQLKKLYEDFDPNNKKTRNIIDAIVELSAREKNNQSITQTNLTNLTDSINDINSDIGTRNTRNQIYTEIDNLYTTTTTIENVIGNVSNLENAPEDNKDILSWLTYLSTELVRIKQKINELHTEETDVPFPEVENS